MVHIDVVVEIGTDEYSISSSSESPTIAASETRAAIRELKKNIEVGVDVKE